MGNRGIRAGNQSRVEAVTVAENNSSGILLGSGSTASWNIALRNGGAGISVGRGGQVSRNVVYANAWGISGSAGSMVTANAVHANEREGISLIPSIEGEFSAYGGNVLTFNNGGQDAPDHRQARGASFGINVCGTDTVCP